MTLIKSISGIRGTIGGKPGEGLSPVDIVKFVYAYYDVMVQRNHEPKNGAKWRVVVGKDARISGEMVEHLVVGTLIACGVDVVCCEFASTPTTELAVQFSGADGGIILTASHNPKEWNALKLLNEDGEFLSAARGQAVLIVLVPTVFGRMRENGRVVFSGFVFKDLYHKAHFADFAALFGVEAIDGVVLVVLLYILFVDVQRFTLFGGKL